MPPLDHSRPPLRGARHWEGFHSLWAISLARGLGRTAPPAGYRAESQVRIGPRVDVGVGALEAGHAPTGGTATAAAAPARTAPPPTGAVPALFPDEFEARIIDPESGPTLVGVIELVGPANKDRPATRRAFAAKCCGYLQAGLGLVVVDVVTARNFHLRNETLTLMSAEGRYRSDVSIHVSSFRPGVSGGGPQIELWRHPLTLGDELPAVPLPSRGGAAGLGNLLPRGPRHGAGLTP